VHARKWQRKRRFSAWACSTVPVSLYIIAYMNAVARPWGGIPQLCPGNIIPFQPRANTIIDVPSHISCPVAGLTSEVTSSRADKVSEYINRAKAAAWYLRLVNHAEACMGCNNASCRKTKTLLSHCETCVSAHACTRPGCAQTKRLQQHSFECRGAGCVLCSLMAETENSNPASAALAFSSSDPIAMQTPNSNSVRPNKRPVDCASDIGAKRPRNGA
jgi:hypothetical protein